MTEASRLDEPVAAADVEALFEVILKRPVGDAAYSQRLAASGITLRRLIVDLRNCSELRDKMGVEIEQAGNKDRWDPEHFRAPVELQVTAPALRPVLIVGSCLMEWWGGHLASMLPPVDHDLYLLGGELPAAPARPIAEYEFQLVQLPLRAIVPDGRFARLEQADTAGHEAVFAHGAGVIRQMLHDAMRWNRAHGILTFVFPLITPQQNPVGRLLPRYELSNPIHLVERLNEVLVQELRAYRNCHFFDLNEIISTYGRRFVQEDMIAQVNHGALLGPFDYEHDTDRLERPRRATERYEARVGQILSAAWHEMLAMLRSVRQTDAVKLVVIDLDDTLWRGVIAERAADEMPTTEGWPRGFWEALTILKRRGVLLAIISNNDEARVTEAWNDVLGGQLTLEDFAVRRIDWRPKPERMAEVLAAVNLLPHSVVFIDDNPVQRAEMQVAFPEIRVLGGDPFTWRHILLWAPETQTAGVTAESAGRTAMVQAQVRREALRERQPRAVFLAGLQLRMHLFRVDQSTPGRLARALELLNKTNQFNTTGQRWTEAELAAELASGLVAHAFTLADVHTKYGLVGVLLVDVGGIRQFVMSCRVVGLGAEVAAISHVVGLFAAAGRTVIEAAMMETSRNLPCRDVYQRCGFMPHGAGWQRATLPALVAPAHISITEPQVAA